MAVVIPQVITEDRAAASESVEGSIIFSNNGSIRFNPTVAGYRSTWTWSGWVKRNNVGTTSSLFSAGDLSNVANRASIEFDSDQIRVVFGDGTYVVTSEQKFRDSRWYHFVFAVDTNQFNAFDRIKMYVNGEQITKFASTPTYPTQSYATWVNNNNTQHFLGARIRTTSVSQFFDGQMSNVYLIDQQQLSPDHFGYTDTLTGEWRPKSYNPINDGRVYCADGGPEVTSNYTIQNSGENLFTGGNGVRVYVTGTDPYILYTPDKPIKFRHSLKARSDTNGAGGATVEWVLNGDTTVTHTNSAASDGQFTTIVDGPGELRSLKVQVTGGSNGASQNATFNAIKVDEEALINSYNGFGTNGFHLPLDGRDFLWKDKSPNENDFGNGNGNLVNNVPLNEATGAIPILNTDASGYNPGLPRTVHKTFNVTVQNDGGNKYFLNGTRYSPGTLPMYRGGVYKFDQSDSTNATHPLRFATAADAAGSTEYTDGVTQSGTPGQAGAYTQIVVPHNAPDTLYYYCTNHGGMGGPTANTTDILKTDPYAWKLVTALPLTALTGVDTNHRDKAKVIRGDAGGSDKVYGVGGSSWGSNDTNKEIYNFYGSSAHFDRNGYLTTPDHADFHLGTNDFTIEFWCYPVNDGGGGIYVLGQVGTSFGASDTSFYCSAAFGTNVYWNFSGHDGTQYFASMGTNPEMGATEQWNHVAITRQGTKFTFFVNGRIATVTTASNSFQNISNNFSVGGAGEWNQLNMDGNLQDVRIYNGVCKYTEEFKCPSTHNLSFVKDSPSGVTFGSQKPTVTGSFHSGFGGNGFVIYPDSNDFLLDGDFTIEAYIKSLHRIDSTPDPRICLFSIGAWQSADGLCYVTFPQPYGYTEGLGRADVGENDYWTTLAMQKDGWVHMAMSRSGSTVRMFIDGKVASSWTSSTTYGNTYGPLLIGGVIDNPGGINDIRENRTGNSATYFSNFQMTDFHLVKGTCLYTESFDPPTEPIQPVANTKLLCMNSSTDVRQCIKGTVEPTYTTASAYAMWPLDSDINDDSGNNRTFTENGGTTTFVSAGDNPFGLTNAASFSGGKYLSFAVSPSSQWTIDFYVKPTSVSSAAYIAGWNGTAGTDQCIGGNADGSIYAANQYGGNTWAVWGYQDSSNQNMYTYEPIVLNKWVHMRLCKYGSKCIQLYLDGKLIGSYHNEQGANSPLTFGDIQSNRFSGLIAGVRYTETYLGIPEYPLVSNNGVLPVSNIIPDPGYGTVQTDTAERPASLPRISTDNPYINNINEKYGTQSGFPQLLSAQATIDDGGMHFTNRGSSAWDTVEADMSVSSGKWYWEVAAISGTISNMVVGAGQVDRFNAAQDDIYPGMSGAGMSVGLQQNGNHRWNGQQTGIYSSYFASYNLGTNGGYETGSIVSVCLDMDEGRIYFFINGFSTGGSFPGGPAGASANGLTGRWRPVVSVNNTTANKHEINFGQRPFKYAPPAGYKMLCSSNLPRASKVAVKPENHFKTFLQDMGGKYYKEEDLVDQLAPIDLRNPIPVHDQPNSTAGFVVDLEQVVNTVDITWETSWSGVNRLLSIDGNVWRDLGTANHTANNTATYSDGSPFRYVRLWINGGFSNAFGGTSLKTSMLSQVQNLYPKGMWWFKSLKTESGETLDQHYIMDNVRGNSMYGFPWDGTTGITDGAIRTYTEQDHQCVGWCWSAPEAWTGTTNYVANSGYRNTDAGFSMWQYNGNGVRGNTTSHGLSSAPQFMLIQALGTSSTFAPVSAVYHHQQDQTNGANPAAFPNIDYKLRIESGTVQGADAANWASTAHTDTLVNLGESTILNGSGRTYQAYAWHEVEGYSRFGRWTGLESSQTTSADGPYIHCGFKPAFVLCKGIGAAEGWVIRDTARNLTNPAVKHLTTSLAQQSTSSFEIDIVANGFKIRTGDGTFNYAPSGAYIFCAWAESPINPLYGAQPNAR